MKLTMACKIERAALTKNGAGFLACKTRRASRTRNEARYASPTREKRGWLRAHQKDVSSVDAKRGGVLALKTMQTPHMQNEANLDTKNEAGSTHVERDELSGA
ncbi:hypothetical protein DVH24_027247 [Malus domestica]|uniref:Uncharacterized protein n=1 Tax=Malus domestica TaxID=3750 RepID=A0A498ILB7_MALDO|nr:hypothetical protein DVH24_027247 [Malus domestica]